MTYDISIYSIKLYNLLGFAEDVFDFFHGKSTTWGIYREYNIYTYIYLLVRYANPCVYIETVQMVAPCCSLC